MKETDNELVLEFYMCLINGFKSYTWSISDASKHLEVLCAWNTVEHQSVMKNVNLLAEHSINAYTFAVELFKTFNFEVPASVKLSAGE